MAVFACDRIGEAQMLLRQVQRVQRVQQEQRVPSYSSQTGRIARQYNCLIQYIYIALVNILGI